jgi:hypothetical protein
MVRITTQPRAVLNPIKHRYGSPVRADATPRENIMTMAICKILDTITPDIDGGSTIPRDD